MADKYIHIDQFLTNISVKYSNVNFFADIIAPRSPVKKSSDLYTVYQKDNLRLHDNSYRSGSAAHRVSYRVSQASYQCEEYALEDAVTQRDRDNADLPLNPEIDTTENLTELMMLSRENRIALVALDSSVVTQTASPSPKWDGSSPTPKKDIFTGIDAIQNSTLRAPTDIFIPFKVAMSLARTSDYTNDYKSGVDLVNTFGLPAKLWGLNVHIVTVGYASSDMIGASDPTMTALWSDNVLIAFIDPIPSTKKITFMRTFEKQSRMVLKETRPMEHADIIQVYEELDEALVSAECGYLLTDCLT